MAEFPYPLHKNLVPNPSLEADATGWSAYGASMTGARVSGDGAVGNWFYRLTATSAAYSNAGKYVDVPAQVSAGETYTASIYVRPSRTITLQSRGEIRNGTALVDGTMTYGPLTLCLAGVWTRIHVEITSTGPGDRIRHQAYLNSARLEVGDTLDLDAECISKGTLTHYFDGSVILPMETLKRRNLNPDPKGSSIDAYRKTTNDVVTVVTDEGEPAIQLLEGPSPNTTLYIDPTTNWDSSHGISAGKWLAHSAEVKAVNGLTNASSLIARIMSYNGGGIGSGRNPADYELAEDSYKRVLSSRQVTAAGPSSYFRTLVWPSASPGEGAGFRVRRWVVAVADTQSDAEAAVESYFDGDTAPSGNLSYRWAPDGTSLEVETIQPPEGLTVAWEGEPHKSTSTLWVGPASGVTGVMDVGISTEARLGIVSDVYSRSREKIQLELARVDSQLIAGERVELDAAAMTASPVVWHWRQITGPTVVLEPHEASLDFIAPDVDEDTTVRIAVYAASEDGRNRSDWHYFDLTIKPPMARYRASESEEFEPVSPKYVGYDRGKREIWNDVIPPSGFSPNARHETEIIDLGILPDDVQFTTGGPPEVAAAGGIYVDLETGDIYRNFGAGYNETDDTTAAPRTNAWWVNPATGDILEWIED